ncbi:hypothetical protein [Streptomyces sp. NPDC091416]|uniref:hypothetical protein n=1 Tax=Streptomyces sp. NPDC091416 TaxID=3366003 RepID=UPI0037F8AC6F
MAEPMDWIGLVTYLHQEKSMAVTGHYRDAIATLLCTVDSHGEDRDRDQIALRIQEGAHAHGGRGDRLPLGLASLAAHAAAIWLASYLEYRLPRNVGTPSLHADVADVATAVWSLWDDRYPPGRRLFQSTHDRAGELREIGAYQAVRRLSAYTTSNNITAAHGALVHQVLRLALRLDTAHRDHRDGDGPAHLNVSRAMDRALGWGPITPRATGQKTLTSFQALDRALAARPTTLSSTSVGTWRGLPAMLGPGTQSTPGTYQAEIAQVLEAGRLLGAAYTRHGEWGQVHSGLVVLTGQIAARTLHYMIAQEHGGPDGFEALDTLIDHVYHRPHQEFEPTHSDPVMAVSRMLRTPYGAALPRWQHQSIRTIAFLHDTSSSDKNLLVHARLSAEVAGHCHGHRNTIVRARAHVIGEQFQEIGVPG